MDNLTKQERLVLIDKYVNKGFSVKQSKEKVKELMRNIGTKKMVNELTVSNKVHDHNIERGYLC